VGGIHTVLHSRTAHLKNPKCTKKFGGRGFVPDPTGEAQSAPANPQLVRRDAKPLCKNPGALAQPFGLCAPRHRNVDFVPTPLP